MQHRFVADVADKKNELTYNRSVNATAFTLLLISYEVVMKLRKKIILLLTVFISFIAVTCLSGCSSITVDGKRLTNPEKITLWRVGLYSPFFEITNKKEIEKILSFFDGTEFVLSDDVLTEADGNVNFEESVWLRFGEDAYYISVAENGKAECAFGDNHYITAECTVDYNGLKAYVDNEIQDYLDKIYNEKGD